MRTSRRERESQATPLGRESVRQAHTLFFLKMESYVFSQIESVSIADALTM